MDRKIQLKHYIPSQFQKFRETDQFIDCILETNEADNIKCHRAVLARYSKWFHQYFQESQSTEPVQRIKIPINPNNVMIQIVDFLYQGYIHFTVDLIVSFLHCADFYKIQILEQIATDQFIDAQCEKTALFFAKKLIECDLTSKYIHLAPIISKQIYHIINEQPSVLSKSEIFQSINPRLFHEVLIQDEIFVMDDYVKAQLIDEFVGENANLSEADKQFLASAIDWGSDEAYKILVNFKCNWVPANISRPLYMYVLDTRRHNIRIFEEQIEKVAQSNSPSKSKQSLSSQNSQKVGRWFLYPWLHAIKYSEVCYSNPQIEIVDFISRLGFLKNKIDAVAYGLFSTKSSQPIADSFQSKYAFSDHNYFLTALSDSLPYISIDFGVNSRVFANQLKMRCHATTEKNTERPPPCQLIVSGESEVMNENDDEINNKNNKFTIASSVIYENLDLTDDFRILKVESKNSFQRLTVAQEVPAQYGLNVLRVLNLEIHGQFLP